MEHIRESAGDRVYRACWQDGSIDLFAGLATAGIGLAWILDLAAWGPIAPAAAIPLWMVFRRRVVEPRLGHVRFDAPRRRRLRRAHVALLLVGCATLVLGVAAYFYLARAGDRPDWVRAAVPALPGVLVGLAGVLSALMFSLLRLAAYGGVFVLGGIVVLALDVTPGWGLLAGGLFAVASGAAMLARFFRQFPVLSNELD